MTIHGNKHSPCDHAHFPPPPVVPATTHYLIRLRSGEFRAQDEHYRLAAGQRLPRWDADAYYGKRRFSPAILLPTVAVVVADAEHCRFSDLV